MLLELNNGFTICFGNTNKNVNTTLPISYKSISTYSILVDTNYKVRDYCTYSMNVGEKTINSFTILSQSNPPTGVLCYVTIGI